MDASNARRSAIKKGRTGYGITRTLWVASYQLFLLIRWFYMLCICWPLVCLVRSTSSITNWTINNRENGRQEFGLFNVAHFPGPARDRRREAHIVGCPEYYCCYWMDKFMCVSCLMASGQVGIGDVSNP